MLNNALLLTTSRALLYLIERFNSKGVNMYNKEYYKEHKEEFKAYYQAHKEEIKLKKKEYQKSHKEQIKAYYQANKEEIKLKKKEYNKAHIKEAIAYKKSDVNANGQTKTSIRSKSWYYLRKYGNKIEGYQIHHCCTYTEPYKFIYCSKEMHRLIHAYLRQHNISADSDHYEYIKHLLDDTVVLYGLE